MDQVKKPYNLRLEKARLEELKRVVESEDNIYESVSHLIRSFINDGLKKLKS